MRLAISNIAWDVAEDEAVSKLLRRFKVDAIDIAPGKYFQSPADATNDDIQRVRKWWMKHGIEITGMQALMFGTEGLNIFGSPDSQADMLCHLTEICRIGGHLGARFLVFGSPKNRDRTGLSDFDAMDIAVSFFRRLADIAEEHNVLICLEPNPRCYGSNFMTTSSETAMVVETVCHPAVKMQLDVGATVINGEDIDVIAGDFWPIIGHVHLSEPGLATLSEGGCDHLVISKCLTRHLPRNLVTIEMLPARDEPHLAAIERALETATRHYRQD